MNQRQKSQRALRTSQERMREAARFVAQQRRRQAAERAAMMRTHPHPAVGPRGASVAVPAIDAGITAAIIGVVATAGASAAQAAQSSMQSPDDRGCVIENAGQADLQCYRAPQPIDGRWEVSPPTTVKGEPSPQTLFEAWKQSGDAPSSIDSIDDVNDLSSAQDVLFAKWIGSYLATPGEVDPGVLSIHGQGEGAKGIAVYMSDDGCYAVAFLIQHAPNSGTTYAGCSLTDQAWMTNAIDNDDDQLSGLIDHINSVSSQYTKLSDGSAQEVSQYGYTCSFSAATVTQFQISYGS